jgi:FixJ family two-component response regulator
MSRSAPTPTVFVVDDDDDVRVSIADLLRSAGLRPETFATAPEFLARGRGEEASCLVLDLQLPGMDGLDVQRELASSGNPMPIIFITAHGDIQMAVRAMKAGATDFLAKPFREQDLLDAIHAAIRKDRMRRRESAVLGELQQRYSLLSLGERRVLGFVVAGLLNKQIAAALGVSEVTVKVRRAAVMRKLQAQSLAELIQLAQRIGVPQENIAPSDDVRAPVDREPPPRSGQPRSERWSRDRDFPHE